ncbi:uncharacterized protein Z518_06192 [Rhinocladiella mackenziei CBS 650.93]|uniref:3-oxoacyl-[acyl-carrier-protein] reductase n=1 Tax=Rhinocladiella mackenziei CBS 650.93 TaxID=1442369 RepID=A0A0D2J8A6_9EURO|nr:uncharacterized protein Z518_06192 [Rhinocladiella mackenziei CBS 650.93]KIX05320.1 hypothetical protein Z518_06192 [Rhinocladiella mackenziei CBS 650.93]
MSLVHIAGISTFCPQLEQSTEVYQRVMSVNTGRCFYLTRAGVSAHAKGRIREDREHSIWYCLQPEAGLAACAAPKSSVAAFPRTTVAEAGPGVTANVVSSGLILTETTWSLPNSKLVSGKVLEKQCVKRYGQPKYVARTINCIARSETEFITGQVFEVNGGMMLS